MNLKINLMSKSQITFSKCRIRVDIFKLLSGICINENTQQRLQRLDGTFNNPRSPLTAGDTDVDFFVKALIF